MRSVPPYAEVRAWARSSDITSNREWRRRGRAGLLPTTFPSHPDVKYQGIGWSGWDEFLPEKIRMSFTEYRDRIRRLNLKSGKEFHQWAKNNKEFLRTEGLTSSPWTVYPDEFLSFSDLIGTEPGKPSLRKDWLSLEEFCALIRPLKLTGKRMWVAYYAEHKKDPEFSRVPARPDTKYKKSWKYLLGADIKEWTRKDGWKSYQELQAYAQNHHLTNQAEWAEHHIKHRPDGVPASINTIQAFPEWTTEAAFFGHDEYHRNLSKQLLEFLDEIWPIRESIDEGSWFMLLQERGLEKDAQKRLKCSSMHDTIKALCLDPNVREKIAIAREETENGKVLPKPAREQNDEIPEASEDQSAEYTPRLAVEVFRALDELPASTPPSAIDWAVKKLMSNLRNEYMQNGEENVRSILDAHPKGLHFTKISVQMEAELNKIHALHVPEWRLEIDEQKKEPTRMQSYTAVKMKDSKTWGNWSGTGAGKTGSAGLAAFALDAQLTVVIVANSNLHQWKTELEKCFRNVHVFFDANEVRKGRGSFLVLNYDGFSQKGSRRLVKQLVALKPDLLVLDEVSLVKQRGQLDKSIRRRRVESLRRRLPKAKVLAMSASPIINDLSEPVSILQLMVNTPDLGVFTRPTIRNAMNIFYLLSKDGMRYTPDHSHVIDRNPIEVNGSVEMREQLLQCGSDILRIEQILMPLKLDAIKNYIKKGTVIYTQYVEGITGQIQAFVENLGFTCALFTGEESGAAREEIKRDFMAGAVDVLIGSQAMMYGVDGLQTRSNQLIILSPPWTSANMDQVEGRLVRPGSAFHSIEIITPRVVFQVGPNSWSWDNDRYKRIESKRDLAACATDGRIPSMQLMSQEKFARLKMQTLADFEQQSSLAGIAENILQEV
jgi:superfamily II DNA or RNA helicase